MEHTHVTRITLAYGAVKDNHNHVYIMYMKAYKCSHPKQYSEKKHGVASERTQTCTPHVHVLDVYSVISSYNHLLATLHCSGKLMHWFWLGLGILPGTMTY